MRLFISITYSFIAILYSSESKADVYKCVTASGIVITSDRVIPECANRNTKVFKNNGALKTEIAPPLTQEEKKKLAEEKEKKRIAEEAESARQKEERYLLAHYSNEQDIQIARQKAVDVYLEKKNLTSEQLILLNKSLNELTEKLKNTPEGSSSLTLLKARIDDLQLSITKGKISLQTYDAEISQIHKRYDETVKRYRIIIGKNNP